MWDRELSLDVSELQPMVTWGTTPAQGVPIGGYVPDPQAESDGTKRLAMFAALDYMGLQPGQKINELPIDAAFIGSCTNSRLSDLRAAAQVLKGRKVAPGVLALVVPGSTQVKSAAEAEGLHHVFIEAGFQWRESGCSLCFYAGGDSFGSARRVVTSTNRNFEGRQGPGVRSHLASPATVAASAVTGRLTDPRTLLSM
jgi:3-isopropylmalate/(R)-2-methylmalate dehydratase large subunit